MVYRLRLRRKGTALGSRIYNSMIVVILVIYVRISPNCKKTWFFFSKEVFCDWKWETKVSHYVSFRLM
jgi:hypothetical protein